MRMPRDTDAAAQRRVVEGLRRMSGAQRLAQAVALREATLSLARVRIRERHGDIPEREARLRLAGLWLDRETMRRVFGWDPKAGGR